MRITNVQYDIKWCDKNHNIQKIDSMLQGVTETDVIVLPEMFTTGFITNEKAKNFAESMDGESINWMNNLSTVKNSAVTGSLIIKDGDNYYNRLIWIEPNGVVNYYDKRHLFSYANEDKIYTPGDKQLIVEWSGFKIKLLTCYDLRFPVWSSKGDFDVIIYVANWPKVRSNHWKSLLVSRAIENQCYVVGVNRIGKDNKIEYSGLSSVITPNGDFLDLIFTECVSTNEIDKQYLNKFRSNFPFLKDFDNFEIFI